jgi:hypothetical protein
MSLVGLEFSELMQQELGLDQLTKLTKLIKLSTQMWCTIRMMIYNELQTMREGGNGSNNRVGKTSRSGIKKP